MTKPKTATKQLTEKAGGKGGAIVHVPTVERKRPDDHREGERPEQAPLFGECDDIVNALELARQEVSADIDRTIDTLTRKKAELDLLHEKRSMLDKALKSAKKMADPDKKTAKAAEK